jgi:hypothetical protein
MAASGQSTHLLNRIKRIIEMKNQPLRSGQLIAACSLAAILIAVSIVCFTPSLAQQSKKKSTQQTAQPQAAVTTGRSPGFSVVDSNGNHHEYGSYDELPAEQQAIIKSVFKNGMKAKKAALASLGALQPFDEGDSYAAINVDSITEAAMKTAAAALEGVDWEAIGRQVDSAMGQVAVVEWPRLSREIRAGLAEAQKGLADPAWKAQIRREAADARQEMAMAMRDRKLGESKRSLEQARREMEQAELKMERARMEMAQAREELKRLRRQQARAFGGYRVRSIPSPAPTPPIPVPFADDIPAPPAPPTSIGSPVPSVAPQPPVAPRPGPSRRSPSAAPQPSR